MILWTVAKQVPLSGAFFRKYWSGLTFPHPENHPDPRVEPGSSAMQADFLPYEPSEKAVPLSINNSAA